nr:hypothetical protein [Tanacetum cinerariifolium]
FDVVSGGAGFAAGFLRAGVCRSWAAGQPAARRARSRPSRRQGAMSPATTVADALGNRQFWGSEIA